MPKVASHISDVHLELSALCEGASSSWPASLVLPVREHTTRFIPYGARIDAFLVEEIDWRIAVIHGYLASRECRPRFHGVASVKPDGRSLSGCWYRLGPMWSREFERSSRFLETEGRQSRRGLLSHSGCFARIVETSVVEVIRSASCSMSRLLSFPTIVRRIPKRDSSQSVPSNTKKNGWFGWSIFAFATQKNAFLTMIPMSTK